MNNIEFPSLHEDKKARKLIDKIRRKREKRENPRMMRILKRIGTTPILAVCTNCAQEFRTPTDTITPVSEAQQILESRFRAHRCERSQQG